ncbi:MAG: OmpA family protein [Crocinitomicaceae bacterium]
MRSLLLIISLIFISFSNLILAQEEESVESSIADCLGAVDVTNFTESNVQLPGNYGKVLDLEKTFPDNFEANSVWLRLEPNLNGEFGFEISTESNIDFNYYLYKDLTGNMCDDILNGRVMPIRKDSLSLSVKGLKGGGESKVSSTLKDAVKTKNLDVYYLLIHSNSKLQGSLKVKYFRNGEIKKTDAFTQNFKSNPRFKSIAVRVRDKVTGEAIEANVSIIGITIDDKLFQGSDFLFDSRPAKYVDIIVNAKGYFLEVQRHKFRASEDTEFIINLEALAPGKKLKMEGLRFAQDSDEFIAVSKIALKRLLDFMVVNNDIKIEIQGHVNAPGYGAKRRVMKISEDRAKQAYKYLVKNGISKDRVTYKGFGNTQMIFPNPKSQAQEEANRRVEIMIVE